MTDRDLLAEGVFGGPLPASERLAALAGRAERLVAVQAEPLPRAPAGSRWLRIHPGIGYLLWRGPSPLPRLRLPRGALAGASQGLERGLVEAVQQALVSLRRRELAALARRHRDPPGFAQEREARAVLVGRLRAGSPWEDAWDWWSEVVLLRHQDQVNAVRRKVVEVIALATCDLDRVGALSWPFRAAIDALYGAYALTPLIAAARERLAALAPLIAPGAAAPAPAERDLPPPLAAALAWAEARLGDGVSLRHAAAHAGVAPEHLARLARAHLGTSFLAHLTDRRLAEARRRLAAGDESLAAVAAACGFGTPEHFQRTFRRQVGTAPGAWRRAARGGLPV